MNGFTLVEVLVTALILSFIVAGIFAVMNVADIAWNMDMGLLQLQQGVRLAADGMSREIRQTSPSGIASITQSGSRIDFTVPDISNPVAYYLQSGRIVREHPAGTQKIIANDINFLNYCCSGGAGCSDCANARLLQINVRAAKTIKGTPVSFSLIEKVKLRND